MNQRYQIFNRSMKILDLGCFPGGWSQVAVQQMKLQQNNLDEVLDNSNSNQNIVSVDILPMGLVEGSYFIRGDLEDEDIQYQIEKQFEFKQIDCILSDMTPNYTDEIEIDHINSTLQNAHVFRLANKILKPGGTLLMRSLPGVLETNLYSHYSIFFDSFKKVHPQSNRKLKYFYYLGQGFKMGPNYLKQINFVNQVNSKNTPSNKLIQFTNPEELQKIGISKDKAFQYFKSIVKQSYQQGTFEINFDQNILQKLKQFYNFDFTTLQTEPIVKEELTSLNLDELKSQLDQQNKFQFLNHTMPSYLDLLNNSEDILKDMQTKFEKKKDNKRDDKLLNDDEELGRQVESEEDLEQDFIDLQNIANLSDSEILNINFSDDPEDQIIEKEDKYSNEKIQEERFRQQLIIQKKKLKDSAINKEILDESGQNLNYQDESIIDDFNKFQSINQDEENQEAAYEQYDQFDVAFKKFLDSSQYQSTSKEYHNIKQQAEKESNFYRSSVFQKKTNK